MEVESKQELISNYRDLLLKHGSGPEVCGWSPEGQLFRFEKLAQIGDLSGRRVLDVGCGIGDLYPFLAERFPNLGYTGIDIVPDSIAAGAARHPGARFMCLDLLQDELAEEFDYGFISGIFNDVRPNYTEFLKSMIRETFQHSTAGIGFNFISKHVNFQAPGTAYYDPGEILDFCIRNLSRNVMMHHHYDRCDVAVFVYR